MTLTLRSDSPEQTMALAEALGARLPSGAVLTLDGDLGAGKTTFVRGLAAGLGIEGGVASPTYTLMQQHDGGRLPLFHFDAWMEGREKALLMDGADEFLGREGVAVVEWGGRVGEWLPATRLAIRLHHVTPEERDLELEVLGDADGTLGLAEALRSAHEAWRSAAHGGASKSPSTTGMGSLGIADVDSGTDSAEDGRNR